MDIQDLLKDLFHQHGYRTELWPPYNDNRWATGDKRANSTTLFPDSSYEAIVGFKGVGLGKTYRTIKIDLCGGTKVITSVIVYDLDQPNKPGIPIAHALDLTEPNSIDWIEALLI